MKTQTEKIKRPTLSISLLSSGRKETIWKCLDSLKPIMEAIDSELIIVDTGCDDETHEQMLTYTDKILKFTWCNDFSKARNVGLRQAKGEWFLFIDDDEWFTDVAELIEFFTTGEYKEYGCANYIQRNYMNKTEKTYRDSWVSRMIRLDKDTRFMSSIHEYLYPVKGKCKLLHCPVDHYGYVFANDQEKYAHSKRNVSLLLDMIKKEVNNPRWWVQLAQEYLGIQEYHKLEELCEEGLRHFALQNEYGINRERGTFYAGLIMTEIYRKDYDRAEERYQMAIQDRRNTMVCRARLHSFGAEIYYKLERFEACEACCKQYLESYEKLHTDELQIMAQSSFFIGHVFKEECRNNVYGFYIASTLKRGDSSVLKDYFYRFDWSLAELIMYTFTPADIVEGMAELPYDEDFVDMANTMMKRRGVDQKVIKRIRKFEEGEKEQSSNRQQAFAKLCKIFAQIDSSNHYILYMKIRNADFIGEMDNLEEIYGKLFGRVINLWELDDSVFVIAARYQLKLEPILMKIKFEHWKRGADLFFSKASEEKIQVRQAMLKKLCNKQDIRFDYFFLKAAEARLRQLEEGVSYSELYSWLADFCKRYLDFYHHFYRDSAFKGEMDILPADCRLAVKIAIVLEQERKGDIKELGAALKACLKVHPPLDKALQTFIKLYADHKKKELEEISRAQEELLQLGNQIKEEIQKLLEQRLYAEAYGIWRQLISLLPQDSEVIALEAKIKEGLS